MRNTENLECFTAVPSPWGDFYLLASERGITRLEFPGFKIKTLNSQNSSASAVLRRGAKILSDYFKGKPADFSSMSFDLQSKTDFEKKVLRRLLAVGRGKTVSYGELARAAGFPGAARAAGSVMRKNPLPVLIPCHRVFAAGNKIGGYSKGLGWKKRLLELEGFSC